MAITWGGSTSYGLKVGIEPSVSGTTATMKVYVYSSQMVSTNSGELYLSGDWGGSKGSISFTGPTTKLIHTGSASYVGTKTFTAVFKIPSLGLSVSVSEAVTVQSASVPTLSPNTITLGDSITVSTNRKSTSYTHTIAISFGSISQTLATGVATSYVWTPDVATFSKVIPNATSGTGKLTLTTKSGSTTVGSSSIDFVLKVPSSATPSINSIFVSDSSNNPYGMLKSMSTIHVEVSSSGIYNSTISSTKVVIGSISFSGSSVSTPADVEGIIPISVTVADSRGRTATGTSSVTVLPYADPTNFYGEVSRLNSTTGIIDPFGTSGKVELSFLLPEVGISDYTYTVQIYKMLTTDTDWVLYDEDVDLPYESGQKNYNITINNIPKDQSVGVRFMVLTPLTIVYYDTEFPVGQVPMSWSKLGVGIGKIWEQGSLDVDGDVYFSGVFNYLPAGVILPYAGAVNTVDTENYLICDGSAFSPTMYPALFAVIGNTYGGTLASPRLPNLQQRVPVGVGDGYALGATGGEAEHTLSVAEMPSHGHPVGFETKGVSPENPLGGVVAVGIETKGVTETGGNTNRRILAAGSWNSYPYLKSHARGGSAAHNNMQPYTVVNWIIKV